MSLTASQLHDDEKVINLLIQAEIELPRSEPTRRLWSRDTANERDFHIVHPSLKGWMANQGFHWNGWPLSNKWICRICVFTNIGAARCKRCGRKR